LISPLTFRPTRIHRLFARGASERDAPLLFAPDRRVQRVESSFRGSERIRCRTLNPYGKTRPPVMTRRLSSETESARRGKRSRNFFAEDGDTSDAGCQLLSSCLTRANVRCNNAKRYPVRLPCERNLRNLISRDNCSVITRLERNVLTAGRARARARARAANSSPRPNPRRSRKQKLFGMPTPKDAGFSRRLGSECGRMHSINVTGATPRNSCCARAPPLALRSSRLALARASGTQSPRTRNDSRSAFPPIRPNDRSAPATIDRHCPKEPAPICRAITRPRGGRGRLRGSGKGKSLARGWVRRFARGSCITDLQTGRQTAGRL